MASEHNEPGANSAWWRENLVAFLLFLAVLGLIVLTAGGIPPFVYGGF